MQRLRTIIHKELIHIIRDKRTLYLILILPAVLLMLLGYSVSNEVENMPFGVVDLSKTTESRAFIDQFTSSGYFVYSYSLQNEEEIIHLMDRNEISAAVYIPPDFGRNLKTGQKASAVLFINGSNQLEAQSAQLAAETISQNNAHNLIVQNLNSAGKGQSSSKLMEVYIKYLYNPDLRRLNYMVPALIAMILQIQSMLLTALSIVREREQGTMEQLIVTPVKSWELMLGKILPYVIITLINVMVTVALGTFWFKVPIAGNVLLLLGLSLIFVMGSLGLGILISNVTRTQMQAMYISSFGIQIPSMILSGFVFPRINMPPFVYWIGNLFPVTYFIEITRGIILKGVGFLALWRYIWPMMLLSLVFFSASVLTFKKHLT
jgi:ABC-2 type transport system permease protein